jgi:hypothetical protein
MLIHRSLGSEQDDRYMAKMVEAHTVYDIDPRFECTYHVEIQPVPVLGRIWFRSESDDWRGVG